MAPVWGIEISPVRGGSTCAVRGESLDSAGSADSGGVDAAGVGEVSPGGVGAGEVGVAAEGIVLARPVNRSRQAGSTASGLC